MRLDEPSWWYRPEGSGAIVRLLRPFGALYGWAVERRFERAEPYRSSLAVICIGNLTAGGTGKTPMVMQLGRILASKGQRPAFLTRGYGGRVKGPCWVDAQSSTADEVGDEALLLARVAPTMVSRDRAEGARAIEASGAASVIIMDDGLQNPSLHKDFTLALVDARRGIGNGAVFPAGPLRARLPFQLERVDAIVVNGPSEHSDDTALEWLAGLFRGPILTARPEPVGDIAWIRGTRLVAFAGIGHPERFFGLLEALGGKVVARVTLPDHHRYTEKDAARILALAASHDAIAVTTEKDFVRLASGSGSISELRARSRTLDIRLALDPRSTAQLEALLRPVIGAVPATR